MIFGWKIPQIITAIWPGISENTRATAQVSAIVADKPSREQEASGDRPERSSSEQEASGDKPERSSSEQEASGDKPERSVSEPTRLIGRHRVAEGDTLTGIAYKYYQDATLWPLIWNYNRHHHPEKRLEDPNMIYPGQILDIPDSAKSMSGNSREVTYDS
jgi:nucleoid-associated protein YgaU